MSLSLRDIALTVACLICRVDGKRIQTADKQPHRYPSAECRRPMLMVDSVVEDPLETLAALLLSVNPASAFMRCSRPAAMSFPASNPSRTAALKVSGARHPLGLHYAIPCSNDMVMLATENTTVDALGLSLQDAIASALTPEELINQQANSLQEAIASALTPEEPTNQPASQPTNQPANHTAKQAVEEVGNQEASRPTRQPPIQPAKQPAEELGNQEASRPTTRQLPVQPAKQPAEASRPTSQPPAQPAKLPAEEVGNQEASRPTRQPPTQPPKQPAEEAGIQASRQPTSQPAKQASNPKADDDQINAALARARAKLAAKSPSSHWTAKEPSKQTANESTSQPSSRPASQPTIQSSSQPINQEISPPNDQTSSQAASQLTSQASSQPATQPNQPSSEPASQTADQSEDDQQAMLEQRIVELKDLLDWRQKVLGKEHEDTLKAMSEVADIKGKLGLLDEAVILKGEVYLLMRRVMGLGRADTLHAMHSYIMTLDEAGRDARAEKLRKEFDENVGWNCYAPNRQANEFSEAGLHMDAVPLRKDLYAFHSQVFGQDHPKTISAGVTYADELTKMGCHAEVAPLRRHLLEMTLQTYGPDHPDTLKAKQDYQEALSNEPEACELPDDYEIIQGGGFSIRVAKDDEDS